LPERVAIVILNWNGRKYLEQFLPFLVNCGYPSMKLVVADNASSDDSMPFLADKYPEIERIQLPVNYGFAKGYNEALKQVDAEFYLLLNSDVEVSPGFLEPMIALMDSDPSIGACQPKIRMYANKSSFEYAGAAGGWLDALGYPFARGRVFDYCETDSGQYEDAVPVFWASGAALLVRSKLYHELGGLDEFFFAHQEEIDFCWRAQLAGYKIYVQPESVVYHVGGGTLPKGNSRKAFLNFRNNLIMLWKNSSLGSALWKVPFRMVLDILSAWRGLLSGDRGYYFAICKAHFHFIGWLFSD